MQKNLHITTFIGLVSLLTLTQCTSPTTPQQGVLERQVLNPTKKSKKTTAEERAMFHEARVLDELYRTVNPITGTVPKEEVALELLQAERAPKAEYGRNTPFVTRGPDNLGGRTRALAIDLSDATGSTMLAGGVSGGMFRTTNGGANWTRVSPNDAIHNVTTVAQDPSNTNRWYYGTGEQQGNSASNNASTYLGQGIWESSNSGVTWTQIANTNSDHTLFNSIFDRVHRIAVHPTTGEVFACARETLVRYDGTNWNTELQNGTATGNVAMDVVITSTGRVYAAFSGSADAATAGIWTSATGNGGWTRIADPYTNPTGFRPRSGAGVGRIVIALAPSNENILYAFYEHNRSGADFTNGNNGEAHLWRWDQSTTTWTNFSGKLPDEAGGSVGNDPLAIQGAYDLCVSVKSDDPNFVVIGGTNAYKIEDITTDPEFERIGGYRTSNSYALYNLGGGDTHHPDVHTLVFDPNNTNRMFSGTDGGIHRTDNISAGTVAWVNLNNNYQTYQYYHVAIDPQIGSDLVIGGAQDNGTTGSGNTLLGLPNTTSHIALFSGDGVAVGVSRDNACIPLFVGAQSGTFFRTCPGGYTNIEPNGSNSEFVTYFYLDPDNNNALYYAGRDRLWRTTNSTGVTTNTWNDMGTRSADFIKSMATSRGAYNPATSYLLIGGDEGHIYRLNDPQNAASFAAAVDITPPTASTTFPSIVAGIAVHPTNSDIVLAVYSNYGINSIYLTNNATAATPTWTLVEQNLSAHSVRSAAITEVSGETVYWVGTARGLYRNHNPTTDNWVQDGIGTVNLAIVRSMAYRPADNRLLLGTHGNGMFEATIPILLSNETIDLKGTLDNRTIVLDWTTENERDNLNFIVERSFDGITFEKIATTASQGDNADAQYYTIKDMEMRKRLQYYRIKTEKLNGDEVISNTIAVETTINDALDFTIIPNPVKDQLNVQLSEKIGKEVELIVRGVNGQVYKQEKRTGGNRAVSIDLSDTDMRSGLYILEIKRDQQSSLVKQFVKQ